MNKIIRKISAALQLVLLAPVKLPGKAMNIINYVALGLGILEKVTEKSDEDGVGGKIIDNGQLKMDKEDF